MPVVYKITNTKNGKTYIGCTRFTSEYRWKQHKYSAIHAGKVTYLYNAIRKYGPDAFTVQDVASAISKEYLSSVERQVIRSFCPEYNLTNGGEVTIGRKYSDKTIEKMRKSNTGKKRTHEQKERMSRSQKASIAKNKERYDYLKRLLDENRGKIDHAVRIERVKESATGRVFSKETRKKLSDNLKKRGMPDYAIKKMAKTKCKKVRCVDTGEVFSSVLEAGEKTGISFGHISKVCNGTRNSANGLKYEFIN
jgi:group I intron endonuclease